MDTLLAGMSSRQFAEWQAYAELEPFGGRQEDFRAAVIAVSALAFGGAEEKRRLLELFPSLRGNRDLIREDEADDG